MLMYILRLGVSFVCVLSCVVSGDDSDIVLTTHSGRPALVFLSSIMVYSMLLLLQASGPRAFGLQVPEGISPIFRVGNNSERKITLQNTINCIKIQSALSEAFETTKGVR